MFSLSLLKNLDFSHVYRLALTVSSLSMTFFVFLVANNKTLDQLHPRLIYLTGWYSYALYLFAIFAFCWVILWLTKFLACDEIEKYSRISVIEPANDAFLPSYLGFFFVAVTVPNLTTYFFVFSIIAVFIFFSRVSYFNPIFLLVMYKFFYVVINGTRILIITKKELKKPEDTFFPKIRRINNYTFIDQED